MACYRCYGFISMFCLAAAAMACLGLLSLLWLWLDVMACLGIYSPSSHTFFSLFLLPPYFLHSFEPSLARFRASASSVRILVALMRHNAWDALGVQKSV
jgi:hypothetical protein